ncbi:MAG: DUF4160 domain-containing protein [Bacteroidota bacterium]
MNVVLLLLQLNTDKAMPTFFTIEGVKIQLFYKDHAPPHFHTKFAEHKSIIRIDSLEIIEGSLPKNKKKLILEWAKENKGTLEEIWNDLNPKL